MASRCRGEVMIAAMIVARKSFVRSDCRGASISECFWCRVRGWSPWTTLPLERGAPAIALDDNLDDGGVVNKAIDGGERHSRIREDPVPLSKGLIGGDQHGTPLVASSDELEQHAGLGLVLGDVGKIIADQQVEAIKAVDGGLEVKLAASQLELLHEIGGAGEEDAPSVLDEGQADSCRQVALAAAGRPEQEQIGALAQPAVTGGERHHLRLRDHRHGLEVEAVEGLPGWQPGFDEMTVGAPATAFGDLVLGHGGEEAGRRPTFLVGLLGKLRPSTLMAGRRSSLSNRLRRAVSTVLATLMRHLRSRRYQ